MVLVASGEQRLGTKVTRIEANDGAALFRSIEYQRDDDAIVFGGPRRNEQRFAGIPIGA